MIVSPLGDRPKLKASVAVRIARPAKPLGDKNIG
jgi:hypothetical protein